jgi:hypothetical protein
VKKLRRVVGDDAEGVACSWRDRRVSYGVTKTEQGRKPRTREIREKEQCSGRGMDVLVFMGNWRVIDRSGSERRG